MSKVIDVIKLVARFVGFDSLIDGINQGATLSETDSKYKQDLLTAVNHTLSNIAVSVVGLVDKKTVTVSGGKFNLTRLNYSCFKVLSLKCNGVDVDMTVKGENLYAADGTYELEYRYVPDQLSEQDDIPFALYPIEKMLALGSAAEVCLMHARFSEAANYSREYVLESERAAKAIPPKGGVAKARTWA